MDPLFPDSVFAVHMDQVGNVFGSFFFRVVGVAADDDEVAFFDQFGSGAVQADDSGTSFSRDGVRGQTIAVGDVVDFHSLKFNDVGGLHQVGVDRDAAFVVQVGFSHRGSVNFRFQQRAFHGAVLSTGTGSAVFHRSVSLFFKDSTR